MVLLNGPVQNALFCLMDRYRNVCIWFMARVCRFPKVGTHSCQRGNHRLPLQGNCRFQRLERMVPNLGTMGYHCKQLPVTRGWNTCPPNLGTIGYHCKELPVPKGWNWRFPTWEPKVTMARNCRFPGLETYDLRFPTWEPEVTIARNCRFPEVRIYVFEAKQLSL